MKLNKSLFLTGFISELLRVLHLPCAFTVFITSLRVAYIPATSLPSYLHLFHARPSSLSYYLFPKHLQKVSCHFVRHICIAVPKGKAVAGEEMCSERRCKKGRARIWEYKTDLSFTKITDAWVTRKHHFTHHLVHYNSFYYIFIFTTLTEKKFKWPKI